MDIAKVDVRVARGDRSEIRCVFLALACLWGTFAVQPARSAPPVFPGCPPSFNCPAPFPADPASTARLILFPGTSSSVLDNEPGIDLDPSCGVLRVADVPFPDDPAALFSGTLTFQPPTTASPGELIVTAATITTHGDPAAGTLPADLIRGDIPLACAEFYTNPPVGALTPGSAKVEIDGLLHAVPGTDTVGFEELEITAWAGSLHVPGQSTSPPAETIASWISAGPASSPDPMNALSTMSGSYVPGPGIIGLKMNIYLPAGEMMELPTSIDATLTQSTAAPSLAPVALILLAFAVLGFGVWRSPGP